MDGENTSLKDNGKILRHCHTLDKILENEKVIRDSKLTFKVICSIFKDIS